LQSAYGTGNKLVEAEEQCVGLRTELDKAKNELNEIKNALNGTKDLLNKTRKELRETENKRCVTNIELGQTRLEHRKTEKEHRETWVRFFSEEKQTEDWITKVKVRDNQLITVRSKRDEALARGKKYKVAWEKAKASYEAKSAAGCDLRTIFATTLE
jgi:chromosome segregation ATPase